MDNLKRKKLKKVEVTMGLIRFNRLQANCRQSDSTPNYKCAVAVMLFLQKIQTTH